MSVDLIKQDEHTLHLHDTAVETITKMRDQVAAATEFWKRHDAERSLKMATSLATQLAGLTSTGFGRETNVYRDGDLSLFVRTSSGFVFGMIFHAQGSPDRPEEGDIGISFVQAPVMGRYCMNPEGEGRACLKPYYRGKPTCEGHDAIPCGAPALGSWSFHS